ncbi:DUF6879 family protein [Cryptosporangium phraense]|uniref:DUF6879 domain-containing protein n=1 Tax=Cryptosporangium phraense TaxID=2593070 RepID=A0A545ASL9_9ACTN|nr:DUF6879 family protein [Cryptosporangium phraense]TQS44324.1 hypothetical protein FL583_15440 [Cryptosporangium phraense]
MTEDDLDRLLETFTDSALRIEARQQYVNDEDADAIAAWKPGRPARPGFSVRTSEWAAHLARTSLDGKRWQRLRIVELPVTPYTAWEVAAYQESAVLGEEIRLLVGPSSHAEDLWIFDGETDHPAVVVVHYDPEGRYVDDQVVADSRLVQTYVHAAARAWGEATPLNDFIAAIDTLPRSA